MDHPVTRASYYPDWYRRPDFKTMIGPDGRPWIYREGKNWTMFVPADATVKVEVTG
jgi:hypothetical protein